MLGCRSEATRSISRSNRRRAMPEARSPSSSTLIATGRRVDRCPARNTTPCPPRASSIRPSYPRISGTDARPLLARFTSAVRTAGSSYQLLPVVPVLMAGPFRSAFFFDLACDDLAQFLENPRLGLVHAVHGNAELRSDRGRVLPVDRVGVERREVRRVELRPDRLHRGSEVILAPFGLPRDFIFRRTDIRQIGRASCRERV